MGGSYAATMAAWFRQKYPHLVKGAWASSAPLQVKLNYFEYTETVAESIRNVGGDECYNITADIFKSLEDLIENDFKMFKHLFKLCDDFDPKNTLDVWNFISSAKDLFSGLVQYAKSGSIEEYCEHLANENANVIDDIESHKLYPFAKLFLESFMPPNGNCVSISYENEIKQLKKDNTTIANAFRPWYYQTCSEFGWYQTTDSEKHPFGSKSPIEFYLKMCQDVFGDV